ncbi:MAG TPA: glycosyltransferase family 4 protein [Anaeromyxobacteraceae bacterium]|jgi:glycosyltransferase involved in cell wall biosynthesis|nr:glycosyltransferase family 4 protein [Anaeromyxobacteraceae bacterium]
MKLALVTNMIPPYRAPVFERLAQLVPEFRVFTFSEMEKNRQWAAPGRGGFEAEVLGGRHLYFARRDWALHLNCGVYRALLRYRPEVVIVGGYDNPGCWLALAAARQIGARVVLWSGSHAHSARARRGVVPLLKRLFVRSCDAYFAYGSLAAEYLVSLGAPRERVVAGVNAVDTQAFRHRTVGRAEVRSAHSSGDAPVVCFSGQLIQRKGLDLLLQAMQRVSADARLWVIGDGPLRRKYEELAASLLPGRVTFLGARPYRELPDLYGAADLLVMPSLLEVWGLVVNEAMAVGLPVVVSCTAGAAPDLVEGKGTGFTVDPNDVGALASAIDRLVRDPELRADMGRRAQELIEGCGTDRYAADMLRAAELARA